MHEVMGLAELGWTRPRSAPAEPDRCRPGGPPVPRLPLQLFDTAGGSVVPSSPEPGKCRCTRLTVYGRPLGHGRFSLVFDAPPLPALVGYEVTYVSNITDIDDKIIDRANREQRLARDRAPVRGGVVPGDGRAGAAADHDPHATDYVGEMAALIERLVARGGLRPPTVYFGREHRRLRPLARQPLRR